MNYAVVKTGGKQYKVSEGDLLEVDRIKNSKGKITLDQVLLLVDGTKVKIGKPFLPGEKVEAELIEDIKGEKIRVSKFKSKVRYRRITGFRASLSKIKISKIGTSSKKTK